MDTSGVGTFKVDASVGKEDTSKVDASRAAYLEGEEYLDASDAADAARVRPDPYCMV